MIPRFQKIPTDSRFQLRFQGRHMRFQSMTDPLSMDYKLIYKPSTVLEAITLTINVITVCISSLEKPACGVASMAP